MIKHTEFTIFYNVVELLLILNFSWARIWQCVCVSVCLSEKVWGSLESSKIVRFGWNLVHSFLGRIPLGIFFFHFWALGTTKRGQNFGEPKNGPIWLKFGTLVPLVNTWGCLFYYYFLKILTFGPWIILFGHNQN